PHGSTRSSFNTTICVLEALLEHERAGGGTPEVTAARLRGQEYLLERRLFRRRSTGEVIERDRKGDAAWTRFAFPTWWHYDVLRREARPRRAMCHTPPFRLRRPNTEGCGAGPARRAPSARSPARPRGRTSARRPLDPMLRSGIRRRSSTDRLNTRPAACAVRRY